LAVIGVPPSLVIVPPEVAVFAESPVMAVVDAIIGAVAAVVVKLNSGPNTVYPDPVAYALI
jgi:hypothetical protein